MEPSLLLLRFFHFTPSFVLQRTQRMFVNQQLHLQVEKLQSSSFPQWNRGPKLGNDQVQERLEMFLLLGNGLWQNLNYKTECKDDFLFLPKRRVWSQNHSNRADRWFLSKNRLHPPVLFYYLTALCFNWALKWCFCFINNKQVSFSFLFLVF